MSTVRSTGGGRNLFSDSRIDVSNDVSPICFESYQSKCHNSKMLGIASSRSHWAWVVDYYNHDRDMRHIFVFSITWLINMPFIVFLTKPTHFVYLIEFIHQVTKNLCLTWTPTSYSMRSPDVRCWAAADICEQASTLRVNITTHQ